MQFLDLFYSVFWVSFLSIIWFFTDTLLYYTQLLGWFETIRYQYSSFVSKNQDKYFPDFLYVQSLKADNRWIKFVLKLASCPFCTTFWLAFFASGICHNFLLLAPIYVITMFVVCGMKRLM